MKNIIKFVYIFIIGGLIGIAIYELLNLVISLNIGEYVRIDSGVIQNIIKAYILSAITGGEFAMTYRIAKNIAKDEYLSLSQKIKQMEINILACVCVISLTICVLLDKITILITLIITYVVVWGIAFGVEYVIDRININKINKIINVKD